MKLGCRAHDYGTHTAAQLAEILHSHGYNACQLAIPKAISGVADYQSITPQTAAEIGEAFAAQGVEISVMGCYQDLSNPDAEVRKQAVANIAHCLSVQKLVGARVVGSESSYANLSEEEKAVRYPLFVDSALRIAEAAAKYDGVFAIEPVFWHPLDTIERTQNLLDAVADKQHFKMIFDAANVLKRKYQSAQTQLWQQWLGEFGEHIEAMHIKDFVLEGDKYCPRVLGEGVMDYTFIRSWLCENRPEMALLREEVQLQHDQQDLHFMRSLVEVQK